MMNPQLQHGMQNENGMQKHQNTYKPNQKPWAIQQT